MRPNEPKVVLAKKLYRDKTVSLDDICATLKMSKSTLYRYIAMRSAEDVDIEHRPRFFDMHFSAPLLRFRQTLPTNNLRLPQDRLAEKCWQAVHQSNGS